MKNRTKTLSNLLQTENLSPFPTQTILSFSCKINNAFTTQLFPSNSIQTVHSTENSIKERPNRLSTDHNWRESINNTRVLRFSRGKTVYAIAGKRKKAPKEESSFENSPMIMQMQSCKTQK